MWQRKSLLPSEPSHNPQEPSDSPQFLYKPEMTQTHDTQSQLCIKGASVSTERAANITK